MKFAKNANFAYFENDRAVSSMPTKKCASRKIVRGCIKLYTQLPFKRTKYILNTCLTSICRNEADNKASENMHKGD
jgi:hypothetical protein